MRRSGGWRRRAEHGDRVSDALRTEFNEVLVGRAIVLLTLQPEDPFAMSPFALSMGYEVFILARSKGGSVVVGAVLQSSCRPCWLLWLRGHTRRVGA